MGRSRQGGPGTAADRPGSAQLRASSVSMSTTAASRAQASEQLTGAEQVTLGAIGLSALSEQASAVTQQLRFPEGIAAAPEKCERPIRLGERLRRRARVPEHAYAEYLGARRSRAGSAPRTPLEFEHRGSEWHRDLRGRARDGDGPAPSAASGRGAPRCGRRARMCAIDRQSPSWCCAKLSACSAATSASGCALPSGLPGARARRGCAAREGSASTSSKAAVGELQRFVLTEPDGHRR